MVTDEERRKVAANLRDSAGNSEALWVKETKARGITEHMMGKSETEGS